MNNNSIVILGNSFDSYDQAIKHLEQMRDEDKAKRVVKSKTYRSNRLSVEMSSELLEKLDQVVNQEQTNRTALTRKIVEQYCDYRLGLGGSIEDNTSSAWFYPRGEVKSC